MVCNDVYAKCLLPFKELVLAIKVRGASQKQLS